MYLKISVDSLENVRTVTSLHLQKTFVVLYQTELLKSHKYVNTCVSLVKHIYNYFEIEMGFSML